MTLLGQFDCYVGGLEGDNNESEQIPNEFEIYLCVHFWTCFVSENVCFYLIVIHDTFFFFVHFFYNIFI